MTPAFGQRNLCVSVVANETFRGITRGALRQDVLSVKMCSPSRCALRQLVLALPLLPPGVNRKIAKLPKFSEFPRFLCGLIHKLFAFYDFQARPGVI
jgi:hypothetical protein